MRIRLLIGILLAGFAAIAMDCSSTGPKGDNLAAPRWTCPQPPDSPSTGDTAGTGGIGVRPGATGIYLRWYIGDDADLEGYQIYRRSTTSEIYLQHATVLLSTDQLLNRRGQPIDYQDTDVSQDVRYDYVLFAIDADTNRSPQSDTLSYTRIIVPTLGEPVNNAVISDPTPEFTFGYTNSSAIGKIGNSIVRVERKVGASSWQLAWISGPLDVVYGVWPDDKSSVSYGTGEPALQELVDGSQYRWRVVFYNKTTSSDGMPPCECVYDTTRCGQDADPSLPRPGELSFKGSTSAWRTFTYSTGN